MAYRFSVFTLLKAIYDNDVFLVLVFSCCAVALIELFFPLSYWSPWFVPKNLAQAQMAGGTGHIPLNPFKTPSTWIQIGIDAESARQFATSLLLELSLVLGLPPLMIERFPAPIIFVILSIYFFTRQIGGNYKPVFIVTSLIFVFNYTTLNSYMFFQGWLAATLFILMFGCLIGSVRNNARKGYYLLLCCFFFFALSQSYAGLAWLSYLVSFTLFSVAAILYLSSKIMRSNAREIMGRTSIFFITTLILASYDVLTPSFLVLNFNSLLYFTSSFFSNTGYFNPLTASYPLYSKIAQALPLILLLTISSFVLLKDLINVYARRKPLTSKELVLDAFALGSPLSLIMDFVINGRPRPEEAYILLILVTPALLYSKANFRWRFVLISFFLVIVSIFSVFVVASTPLNSVYNISEADIQSAYFFGPTIRDPYLSDAMLSSLIALSYPSTPATPVFYYTNSSIDRMGYIYNSSQFQKELQVQNTTILLLRTADMSVQFFTVNVGFKPLPSFPTNSNTLDLVYNNGYDFCLYSLT